MKLVIDHLDDLTDWIVNSPSTITEIEFDDYIAGLNEKSLLINFDSVDTVRTAVKTFTTPFDVTNYDTLVLSIWSRNKYNQKYYEASDFNYKIKINSTDEYYLAIYETMTDVSIGIEEITEIDRIEITPIHQDDDYIIISEMIVEKEEPATDIMNAVKEYVDYFLEKEYSDGISIATGVSGSIGNNYINIANYPPYIDRYAVIKIKEGTTEEIHQIQDCDGLKFYFDDNYDGETLINDFTSAEIFITFPCYMNPGQVDVRLPGIALWGIDPEPILTDAKLFTNIDTYSVNNDNFKMRQIGQILKYKILIDLEAYQPELLEKMAQVIRRIIARESLWINGRRHDIFFKDPPVEQKPTKGIEIIPKIQYSIDVSLRENIFDRIVAPKTTTINLEVYINN